MDLLIVEFEVLLLKRWVWLLTGLVATACSMSVTIWSLAERGNDPLFRFVRGGKAGFIDRSGRVVMGPSLTRVFPQDGAYREGLLAVVEGKETRYLDRTGALVFRVAGWGNSFAEGLAAVRVGDKWGFIDKTGKWAVAPRFHWVSDFADGLAMVEVLGEVGSTGYINREGKMVIPANLSVGDSFREGLAAVVPDGPCRITNGGSCDYSRLAPTGSFARHDCRFVFIDKTGRPVTGQRYDSAQEYSEGLAGVRVGDLWGYVDHAGKWVIPARFTSAAPFSDGLARVSEGGRTFFITRDGVPRVFAEGTWFSNFSEGRTVASSYDGKPYHHWFIDKTGKRAVPGTFAHASDFRHGLAHVAITEEPRGEGKYAWIDTSGKTVFAYSVP